MKIIITLEEQLGANKLEVSSQVTDAIWSVLEQPGIQALALDITVDVELGDNPDFYPVPDIRFMTDKGVEKTEANSCQLRFIAGDWVISTLDSDYCYKGIDAVLKHINHKQLYITNETIITEEYAKRLWYKI